MKLRSSIALALLLFAAAGCTTASLKELRHTAPKGTAFQSAISALYLEYAESEAAQYDWWTSQHFADKGLLAVYGNDTAPESPDDWNLPPEKRGELNKAHEALIAYLPAAIPANPQQAAKAQYYYDCWVEQQHEAWQTDDIESCRQGFYGIVKQPVEAAAAGSVPTAPVPAAPPLLTPLGGAETTPVTNPYNLLRFTKLDLTPSPASTVTEPMAPLPGTAAQTSKAPLVDAPISPNRFERMELQPDTAYPLYFETALALSPESRELLAYIRSELTATCQVGITLNGHADIEDGAEENLDLSQKRVDVVKAVLMEKGIAETCIESFAFGETDPKMRADDGVVLQENNRVDILLSPR